MPYFCMSFSITLDISKAFGEAWYLVLLNKLCISGKTTLIVKSFLNK